jgi:hypothetical protein
VVVLKETDILDCEQLSAIIGEIGTTKGNVGMKITQIHDYLSM